MLRVEQSMPGAHKEELDFNGFGESSGVPQRPKSKDQCHEEAGHDRQQAQTVPGERKEDLLVLELCVM